VGALVGAFAALMGMGADAARSQAGMIYPTHGWQMGSPAGVGLDEKTLADLDVDLGAGKERLIDSFQVFRCGKEVFERKYAHDYASIYGKEAKTKGPLNARLTVRTTISIRPGIPTTTGRIYIPCSRSARR